MLRSLGTNKKATRAREVLAANMRKRRVELGYSQEQLAELADLHRTYVNTVERCQRNIGLDGIERIAKALQLSVADLLRAVVSEQRQRRQHFHQKGGTANPTPW